MRKYVLLYSCFLLICTSVSAQVSIGLQGGYTGGATAFIDPSGTKRNTDQLRSWHADLVFNVPIEGVNNLYLQPLIRYITKGTYFTPSSVQQGNMTESAYRLDMHYIELPFNVAYKIPLGVQRIVLAAGPYAAYSVGGFYSLNILSNGQYIKNATQSLGFNMHDGFMEPGVDLSRWDMGANFMAGLELNGMLMLNVNYSYGTYNLDRSHMSHIKNRYLGISIGVLLNREDY